MKENKQDTTQYVDLTLNDDGVDTINLNIEKEGIVESINIERAVAPKSTFLPDRFYYRRIGNTFTFWSNKDGDPLVVIGPHWPFYMCFSTSISVITFLFFGAFWPILSTWAKYIGMGIYALQIISYTLTFLKNPGLPSLKEYKQMEDSVIAQAGVKFCNECHMFVNTEENVHHCSDCNTCIEGYDHHCPWTSKCVGKGNLISFYVFVASTFLLFGYLFFAFAISVAPIKQ